MKRWKQICVITLSITCLVACNNKTENIEPTPTPTANQSDIASEADVFIIHEDMVEGVAYFDEETGNILLNGIVYRLTEKEEAIVTNYYEFDFTTITIPSEIELEGKTYPVTAIGEDSLSFFYDLEEVILPDSITSIGIGAFYGCTELKSVILSKNLKKIDDEAFYGCYALSELILPNGLEIIGREAFCTCESLVSIELPDTVKSVGNEAFFGCIKLKNVILSDAMVKLPLGLFANCENLSSVVIPDNVVIFDDEVFWACENLKEINLPANLISIGDRVFYSCGVTSIRLPAALYIDDAGVFSDCDFLNTLYVADDMLEYYAALFEAEDFNVLSE